MEEKLRILLTVDRRDTTGIPESALRLHGFEVIPCPRDGKVLFEAVRRLSPDIVIMDMFLRNADAPSVCTQIRRAALSPVLIVCANYDNGLMSQNALQAGATYFFIRPFDYDLLARRIRELHDRAAEIIHCREMTDASKPGLEEKITNLLHAVGVPAHIRGYHFLRSAITLSIYSGSAIQYVTKDIYPQIARMHGSTPTRVERNIRHAVSTSWDRGDMDTLASLFGPAVIVGRDKPSNSEFIAALSDKLRLENHTDARQAK